MVKISGALHYGVPHDRIVVLRHKTLTVITWHTVITRTRNWALTRSMCDSVYRIMRCLEMLDSARNDVQGFPHATHQLPAVPLYRSKGEERIEVHPFSASAARKHAALLQSSLSVAWHAIWKMHSEKLSTSQTYDHWHQQKCQFIALVAEKLRYIEIEDNLASLYGRKNYVAFSGHDLIKTEILCYIENFVMSRFNGIVIQWVVWKVSSSMFSTYKHSHWEGNNILLIPTRLAHFANTQQAKTADVSTWRTYLLVAGTCSHCCWKILLIRSFCTISQCQRLHYH